MGSRIATVNRITSIAILVIGVKCVIDIICMNLDKCFIECLVIIVLGIIWCISRIYLHRL